MTRVLRILAVGALVASFAASARAQGISIADGGLQRAGVVQERSTVTIKGTVGNDAFELQIFVPVGRRADRVTRSLHNVACVVADAINAGRHGVNPVPIGNGRLVQHYEAYPVAPQPGAPAAVRFKPRGNAPPALTITSVTSSSDDHRTTPVYGNAGGRNRLADDAATDEEGWVCRIDTDGDGDAELVLRDADNDGSCEFPRRKTVLRGDLRCTACEPLEFEETTIVEADTIVVESDGRLSGGESLRSLTLVPLSGDLTIDGMLEVSAGDDVTLRARAGDVVLGPGTRIDAVDRLLIEAKRGSVRMTAGDDDEGDAVATAGTRIDVNARGAQGDIVIDGGHLVSRRVTLSARANLSVVDPKRIVLRNGAILSTDLGDLGVSAGPTGNVTVDATGAIRLEGAVIRSSRNVVFATARPDDAFCASDASEIAAVLPTGASGFIDLRGVRGPSLDDGSTLLVGVLRGVLDLGTCP